MEINGKKLSVHGGGDIIYYDNILIKSKSGPELNAYTNFEFWEQYLPKHPEFCGCQYHKMMWGHCEQSKHLKEQSEVF